MAKATRNELLAENVKALLWLNKFLMAAREGSEVRINTKKNSRQSKK